MDPSDPSLTVNVETLASLFGISDTRIQQLAKPKRDGTSVIAKASRGQYKFADSVRGYMKYLQSLARGWGAGGGIGEDGTEESEYGKHKARLYRFRADKAEVEAKLLKGNVHDADAVKAVWGDMIGRAKVRLLALPTTLAAQLEGMSIQERQEAIRDAVFEALAQLANYSPEAVTGQYLNDREDEPEELADEAEDDEGEEEGGEGDDETDE